MHRFRWHAPAQHRHGNPRLAGQQPRGPHVPLPYDERLAVWECFPSDHDPLVFKVSDTQAGVSDGPRTQLWRSLSAGDPA